jgi:hypothetical protein
LTSQTVLPWPPPLKVVILTLSVVEWGRIPVFAVAILVRQPGQQKRQPQKQPPFPF